jgi:hypothetical protein
MTTKIILDNTSCIYVLLFLRRADQERAGKYRIGIKANAV